MTRRITRRATLGAAGALMTPALLRQGAAQTPTTVTMWTFLDPSRPGGRETALKRSIESFEAAHPSIRIRVEPQVWTTLGEKFVLGHNSRNAPDIGWVNAENMGLILNTDAAADLKPLIVDHWPAGHRADLLLPAWLDSLTVEGRLLAMPIMASTWVLMVRRDLMKAAGVGDADLRTWDGVTEAARKMTRDTNGDGQPDVWGLGIGLATERFSVTPAVLAAIGAQGGLFGDACRAQFANPAGARALAWQADLITRHRVVPREAVAMTSDDAIDQFAAGRYAMQIVANSRFEQIQRTAAGWNREDLGMLPIPNWTTERPGPTLISGWSAVVWRNSPRLREATRFVEHMTSPATMALWTDPGAQVPMLRSLLDTPAMAEPRNAPQRQVAEMFGASGLAMPGQCNWARTLADFNLATQQVVLGQRSVEDALKRAERATQDRQ
ncbi:sugar ABC transporter substrate-binding protein [Roseomonas sp. OT10]|uniref:ABC transporter substrate-binding protein n=1 Tax=Roseomonas cutis TaxID=2897332 RepID=UPI001E58FAE9|nr:sugar ABC transporter substrate-binding protein [Roseomonas sp. OT10]UFN47899.1 sugar ABC transporter substrate-binding protein [Roseomonas sp. OT10]